MCPPPCGPRRHSRPRIKSDSITKAEVDEIILGGDFTCTYRFGSDPEPVDYEGCLHNLHLILHDADTRVRVLGSRSKDYLTGYRTVVMSAPCFPATFFLRVKQ